MQEPREWEQETDLSGPMTADVEKVGNKRETRALDEPYVDEVLPANGPSDVVQGCIDWFMGELPQDTAGVNDRLKAFREMVVESVNENIQGSYRFSGDDLEQEVLAIGTRMYLYQTMIDGSDATTSREMAALQAAREAIAQAVSLRTGGSTA